MVRNLFGYTFAEAIITLLQPLFTAADGYLGICIIWGAMAMFWFVGVHGPSIVEPAIAAIIYANVDANLALFKAGHQAANVLTVGLGLSCCFYNSSLFIVASSAYINGA